MRKYTTVQGDMWDSISLRVYETENRMHELLTANYKHRHVVVFPANIVLDIPEVSKEDKITFPPWRRNS